jgi:deazaflavin-dependent oxidoreductase (nitroreductase family)
MTIHVTPAGTRGTPVPRLPGPLVAGMNRLINGMYRRLGSRMRVGGQQLLILRTIGSKSGQERETVLSWWPDETSTDGAVLVAATYGGSAQHPAWFLNLATYPDKVWIEREGKRVHVRPETLTGTEREEAWRMIVARAARYGGYEEKTDREIPVVRLRPVELPGTESR